MDQLVKRFRRDHRGATAVEYGLLAGLIAIGIAAGMRLFASNMNDKLMYLGTTIAGN